MRGRGRRATTRSSFTLVVWLLTGVTGCGSDAGTRPQTAVPPTLSIVAGSAAVDTIEAELAQALTVQVNGTDGKPMVGAIVRFSALRSAEPARPGGDAIRVASLASFNFAYDVSDTTNASGRAFAAIKLGITAGKAEIVVTVPEFGLRDSAHFTVKAGRPERVVLSPHDTITGVGRDVAIGAITYDQRSNVVDAALTYSVTGTSCAPGTTAIVRGSSIGTCWLKAATGQIVDSARVTVMPRWTVVGFDYVTNTVVRIALETGTRTDVAPATGFEVFPSAGVQGNVVFRSDAQLVRIRPDGERVAPLVTDVSFEWAGWARLSRDEQSVYFASSSGVYRSSIEGTGTTLLIPYATTPDPSTDGRLLTYSQNQQLGIYNLSTKAVTYLRTQGTMPRWSPTGDRIAFVWLRRVWVVFPDGTGLRAVTPASLSILDNSGLDWSPDGQWILTNESGLAVFRVDGSDYLTARLGSVVNFSVVR